MRCLRGSVKSNIIFDGEKQDCLIGLGEIRRLGRSMFCGARWLVIAKRIRWMCLDYAEYTNIPTPITDCMLLDTGVHHEHVYRLVCA